jgi:hypothetical protein
MRELLKRVSRGVARFGGLATGYLLGAPSAQKQVSSKHICYLFSRIRKHLRVAKMG